MASFTRRLRARPQTEIETQLRSELASLAPLLGVDHCSIRLHSFDLPEGIALLEIDASCADCGASGETFLPGIETALRLRVTELRAVRVFIPDAR